MRALDLTLLPEPLNLIVMREAVDVDSVIEGSRPDRLVMTFEQQRAFYNLVACNTRWGGPAVDTGPQFLGLPIVAPEWETA